ncbi:hypothetical protein F0562_034171 [Nyssa sinensis]|uniref:Uncharacterized protein n=1 Tax=Nyssa sinensis TaxID=561372 RepID=A0A5J5AHN6_9ASTE|nr:hypothetical protein F0562_034171 [Nyssa sinensis]
MRESEKETDVELDIASENREGKGSSLVDSSCPLDIQMKMPLFSLIWLGSFFEWERLLQFSSKPPDFDGQELTLKLHRDGKLGTMEGSSGKSYDVVSFSAQDPDATVFQSSASESKIVGKISRRVSLVNYPEPAELQKHDKQKQKMYQRSSGTSLTNSLHHFATPTQGSRPRNLQSAGGNAASTHSSRRRSSLSEVGEPSKPPKGRHVDEPTRSLDQSAQDSGRHHSMVISSASLEDSKEGKSKKKKRRHVDEPTRSTDQSAQDSGRHHSEVTSSDVNLRTVDSFCTGLFNWGSDLIFILFTRHPRMLGLGLITGVEAQARPIIKVRIAAPILTGAAAIARPDISRLSQEIFNFVKRARFSSNFIANRTSHLLYFLLQCQQ